MHPVHEQGLQLYSQCWISPGCHLLSQDTLLYSPGETAGTSFQTEFHQLYLILFCQQQNPGHLLHSLEDGSAFLNLSFGVVSRLYPLFYLTLKSVQNAGFTVYPVISSKDWTLYLCLPSAKDNFLSHFHFLKEQNCSTSKKETVQTDFVNN